MKKNFKVGDKVFAKVKGYPHWPARISAENGKKYKVEFYGTGETGTIKKEDLFYYIKNKERLQKPLKRKDYIDAFEQIEEAIKEDGGDGDENPDSNDSISNSSVNTPNINNSVEKKTIKRKRSLAADTPEIITPKKKSARFSKTSSEDTQKSDDTVNSEEKEKEKKATPKKSPKIGKSPKVDENEEAIIETQDENTQNEETNLTTEEEKDNSNENKNEEKNDSQVEENKVKGYKIDLVSEKSLKNNIIYAEYVRKSEKFYKERKVEPREDHINQLLPVKLPSGKMGGIKLHISWPLEFENEFDRAMYDEEVAKRVLELKEKLDKGEKSIIDDVLVLSNIELTEEAVQHMFSLKNLHLKESRMARLELEAELLGLDVKIKNCLGLDKADPKKALKYLEQMYKLEFDDVVLKKHLHIVEMVRRLRKYVGNTKEWKMSDESLNEFTKQAEMVRDMAEKVYGKFKETVNLPENSSSFFDGFTELVNQFKADCKEMELSESEIYALSAEPRSRLAFLNRLDEKEAEKDASKDAKTQEKVINGSVIKGGS